MLGLLACCPLRKVFVVSILSVLKDESNLVFTDSSGRLQSRDLFGPHQLVRFSRRVGGVLVLECVDVPGFGEECASADEAGRVRLKQFGVAGDECFVWESDGAGGVVLTPSRVELVVEPVVS